jgi:hypothetical protein
MAGVWLSSSAQHPAPHCEPTSPETGRCSSKARGGGLYAAATTAATAAGVGWLLLAHAVPVVAALQPRPSPVGRANGAVPWGKGGALGFVGPGRVGGRFSGVTTTINRGELPIRWFKYVRSDCHQRR